MSFRWSVWNYKRIGFSFLARAKTDNGFRESLSVQLVRRILLWKVSKLWSAKATCFRLWSWCSGPRWGHWIFHISNCSAHICASAVLCRLQCGFLLLQKQYTGRFFLSDIHIGQGRGKILGSQRRIEEFHRIPTNSEWAKSIAQLLEIFMAAGSQVFLLVEFFSS